MEIKIRDSFKVKAKVVAEFFKADTAVRASDGDIISGELVKRIEGHNKVVDVGLDFIAHAISAATTPMSYIACGSGSTAAAAGDTTLETEIDRVAIIGLDYNITPGAVGEIRFRAIFEANQGNGNLREFGLLNAATLGDLFARYVLGASFTKDSSLLLRVYWTVTGADA